MFGWKTKPSTQMSTQLFAARAMVGKAALGAGSAGALAAGALALGAVSIGALAIGRLVVGSARLRRVEIGELVVGSVRIGGIGRGTDGPSLSAEDRNGRARPALGSPLLALEGVGNVFYFVDDLDGAVAWYGERLGREPIAHGAALAAFDVGGARLTLHQSDGFNSKGPSGVAAYWTVADVDALVKDWTRHGAKLHRGPRTVFTGERLCQLLDPFGNLFAVREASSTRNR